MYKYNPKKITAEDLLDLYVSRHYEDINNFLRYPDRKIGYKKAVSSIDDNYFQYPYGDRASSRLIEYDNPESVASQVIASIPNFNRVLRTRPMLYAENVPPEDYDYTSLLYRGTSFGSQEELNHLLASDFAVGNTVGLKGFTSTSKKPSVANRFTNYHRGKNYPLKFEYLPNSETGYIKAYQMPDPFGEGLEEYIIPHNSKFKVVDVYQSSDTVDNIPIVFLQDQNIIPMQKSRVARLY